MTYLLDTSIIIDILRRKETARDFILDHMNDEIVTSAVCKAEIMTAVFREQTNLVAKRLRQVQEVFQTFTEVVAFDSGQAEIAGQLKAQLQKKGEMIDDLDILIAASALSLNAILVSHNTKHFRRIPSLRLIDS